mmetsp:Transcript_41904/g.115528  ORF Transcript_41904/g.115528 Transcript_41904/m.115528 type:complete len:249 (+) Transcript_41904:51-797(+)
MAPVQKVPGPGPGQYDVAQNIGDGGGGRGTSKDVSFGNRAHRDGPRVHKTRAGPGAYHPKEDLVKRRSPGYGFGGGARRMLSDAGRQTTPGPVLSHGDTSRYKASPSHSFGCTEKFFRCPGIWDDLEGRGARHPAPGEYNIQDKTTSKVTSAPAFSATPRREQYEHHDQKRLPAPGPGAYRHEGAFHERIASRAPQWRFGTTKRAPSEVGPRSGPPGPGNYVVTKELGETVPKWSMGGKAVYDKASYL